MDVEKHDEFDTCLKEKLMCPHCGKTQNWADELEESGGEYQCGWCHKFFDYKIYIANPIYSTKKRGQEWM